MARNRLDPRTQTDGKSSDAKRSAAADAKVPPSFMDSKVGVEDQEVAKHVDEDVEESARKAKDPPQ
ncbi:MAG TPA: hypothetical protein VGR35_17375 [Tepidisphaeraceae bacterium]|nr:hypothetical protein [Tepidisphaeraceae bacterium]